MVAAEAVRTMYQQLFVKVRIPGYGVTAADFDDAEMRRDLIAFVDAALSASTATILPRSNSGLSVVLDEGRLRRARVLLAEAPLGAAALSAVGLFLPFEGNSEREQLVGSYVSALISELSRHSGAAGDVAAALAADASSELDLTREAIVALRDADGAYAGR